MKKFGRIIGFFSLGLVVFLIGAFLFLKYFDLRTVKLEKLEKEASGISSEEITANLIVDFGDGRIITCNNQKLAKEKTVFDLLEICSKNKAQPFELKYEVYPELGVFVKQIGDKVSGEDQKFWQFWVNNIYSQVGASQYQLKDGDVVEWKFIKSQF